jgi:hypothetical protein
MSCFSGVGLAWARVAAVADVSLWEQRQRGRVGAVVGVQQWQKVWGVGMAAASACGSGRHAKWFGEKRKLLYWVVGIAACRG